MSGSTTSTAFTYTGHTVTWTVPSTGLYDITAAGAKGGNGAQTYGLFGTRFYTSSGGPGALMGGDYELTQGEVLTIAVGGVGANGTNNPTPIREGDAPPYDKGGSGGGGGGGSFVVGPGNTPLVIAGGGGGGGGARNEDNGGPGLTGTAGGSGRNNTNSHGGDGGTDGAGGSGSSFSVGLMGTGSGGGGGFKSSGSNGSGPDSGGGGGGYPGLQGGQGRQGGVDGGFGGGGGSGGYSGAYSGGGGGGGYSGGGGGPSQRNNFGADGGGGGGGSYLAPGAIDPVEVQGQNQLAGDVVITPVTVAPVIAGTQANQQTTDNKPIDPFAQVSITDPSQGSPTETVVVAPSSAANGTLSDPNQAADGSSINGGIFKVAGSPSAVTAALNGVVFTPTQVAFGQQVTTGFTIVDANSAGLTATDNTTSVVATAAGPPTLAQPVLTYTVAEGQTLQGLYGDILANVTAANPADQASLTISSIGEAGTAGFLYPDLAQHMLTYTADGYNLNKPTDSFTYTVADPSGATTGTVDVAVTGPDLPTRVGTAGSDKLDALPGGFQRLVGLGGDDQFYVARPNALVFGGRGNDDISAGSASTSQGTRDASGSTLYGGPGTNVIRVNGSAQETIVLQQGGTDIVTGFDPQNGDVLDLRQALAESQLNLGGDYGKLGTYVQVTPANGFNATLSFNPNGLASGPGTPLAELRDVGPGVTLATLISDHALAIT